jgi:hypothetical protein
MSTRAVIVDGTVKRSAVAGSQLLKRGQQRRLHSKRVATLIMNGEELYTQEQLPFFSSGLQMVCYDR